MKKFCEKLDEYRIKLIKLRDEANKELEEKVVGVFHFSGEILTGKILKGEVESLDTLFIGINPGGGRDKDGKETVGIKTIAEYVEEDFCKYVGGYKEKKKWEISKKLVDKVLPGNVDKNLKYFENRCAEMSFKSFFATVDEKNLDLKLNSLSED